MRVRLIKDLTKYDPNLVIGAEGCARINKITYTDWEAEMIEVKIPGAKALPIGWNALEIIDKAFWIEKERQIKNANKIELVVGPRGAFKWLRIYYHSKKDDRKVYTTNCKSEAEKILVLGEKYGIEILKIVK